MSNDFILGSLAGILSTVLLALLVYEILKFSFEGFNNRKKNIGYVSEIFINLFFNLLIWFSVKNDLYVGLNFASFVSLVIAIGISSKIAHRMYFTSNDVIGKLLNCVTANIGIFSFVIGIFCCLSGWDTNNSLLTYGSIFIGIGSFSMMFFIAFAQIMDSQQKDKSVKN